MIRTPLDGGGAAAADDDDDDDDDLGVDSFAGAVAVAGEAGDWGQNIVDPAGRLEGAARNLAGEVAVADKTAVGRMKFANHA